jgi:hypothetical protein
MSGDKDDIKTIRILEFSGKEDDWDEWSEKFQEIASERGYHNIMIGTETAPSVTVNEDELTAANTDVYNDVQKKEIQTKQKANLKGYRDLQLLTSGLSFTLVKLCKTTDLPQCDLYKAWQSLREEFEPTAAEDKIELLLELQQNKLEDPKCNISERIASLKEQQLKLKV